MTTRGEGVPGGFPAFSGADLTPEIARLANEMFSGLAPEPGFVAPPVAGPSALSTGAGGVSTSNTLPPTPGAFQSPPLASSPLPKESDLRGGMSSITSNAGFSPLAVAGSPAGGAPGFASTSPLAFAPALLAGGLPPGGGVPDFGGSLPLVPPTPGVGGVPDFGGALPLVPPPTPGVGGSSYFMPPSTSSSPGAEVPYFLNEAPLAHVRPDLTKRPDLTEFSPELAEFRPEVTPELCSSSGAFNPYAVKRDFPILEERVHGKRLVWLDNAATTQKPQAVIDRLSYFYAHENSNIHRAAHALAARATDAYEGARDKVRKFLNAPSVENIVFVRGTTEAINLVAQSWGRRNVSEGDEIVVTWLEHHANIVPWQQLAAEKGAVLKVAPVDEQGQVNLEAFERLLGPKTRMVSITQVSNALGTVVPVKEMTQIAHRYGATVLVDGAQAVSHVPVDVQDIDSDFYVFSGHKVFGPTGIGALFGKGSVLEAMPPWQGGGNMISDVRFEKTTYQAPPWRFEAGTGNIADAVGLGAAIDYVSALGMHNIARYEHELLEYATGRLLAVPGLTLIGTAPGKAGVLSFVLDGQRTEDVGKALDQEGIAVRSGHHCAQPILRRFGYESTVRASLAPYNTCEDIDALVAVLLRLQAGRPR